MINKKLQTKLKKAGYKGKFDLENIIKDCENKINMITIYVVFKGEKIYLPIDKNDFGEAVVELWLRLNKNK